MTKIFLDASYAIALSATTDKYHKLAEMFADTIEAEGIVPLSEELYKRGWLLYRERMDKEWSLTNCISFIVMQERSLTDALTTDKHFRQAGFIVLLDEEQVDAD